MIPVSKDLSEAEFVMERVKIGIDDLCVEYPPSAILILPEAGPSAVRGTNWGGIKALFR